MAVRNAQSSKNIIDPSVTAENALRAFGAVGSYERRVLSSKALQWTEEMIDMPQFLMYLSRKSVIGTNGRPFDIITALDVNSQVKAFSLGISTAALEMVERGDVLSITYLGDRPLPGGHRMKEYDIQLIGHADLA